MRDPSLPLALIPRRYRRRRAGGGGPPDLGALCELTRADLKGRWQDLYGSPPPTHISRKLLLRAVAYRMQEEAYGELSVKTRKRLARAARDLAAGRSPKASAGKIKPGTRLLREWQGIVHEAMVLENSVRYRDKDWPSLSAVAREITGARCSGPRFFGIAGKVHDQR